MTPRVGFRTLSLVAGFLRLGGSDALLSCPSPTNIDGVPQGSLRRSACVSALTTMSAATLPEMATATGIPSVAKEGEVIVGGGPSGLATALMLAKRGWRDISVIERTPSADFFDKELAFV